MTSFGSRYRWVIRTVPGERVRRIGWWLNTAPPGKTIRSNSLRCRAGRWLLAVTDDRSWTLRRQTPMRRFIRRWLGRGEREWELRDGANGESQKIVKRYRWNILRSEIRHRGFWWWLHRRIRR